MNARLTRLELPLVVVVGLLLAMPARREPRAGSPRGERPPLAAKQTPLDTSCASFPCAFVRRLMRPDQAPPLDRPRALAARAASLPAGELVLGVELGGRARAYPLNLLRYHRVINDRIGGESIAVTHSPISGASLCLRSAGVGRLRHSGSALEGDELLLDERGALWSPLLGAPIREPAGEAPRLACPLMTWGAWRRLHPRTELASPPRASLGFDYRRDPWEWYRRDRYYLFAPVHYLDLRLPHKQEVLGVKLGAVAYAFPLPMAGKRVINTTLEGRPVRIVLDAERGFADAFERLAGGRLQPLEGARRALFFAWAAHHQKSIIAVDEKDGALTRRDEHAR